MRVQGVAAGRQSRCEECEGGVCISVLGGEQRWGFWVGGEQQVGGLVEWEQQGGFRGRWLRSSRDLESGGGGNSRFERERLRSSSNLENGGGSNRRGFGER